MDNGNFGDEQFIYCIGMQSKPVHVNSFSDGYIIIDDEKLEIKRRRVLNKQISVIMPEKFVVLEKELAELKYPTSDRPNEIYTNYDTTINFSLSHRNETASNEDIPEIKDMLQDIILRMYPTSKTKDSAVIDVSGLTIAYFDFSTAAIDMDVYNATFVFSLGGRLVLGAFNCPQENADDWKLVFIQMLQSIELANH
ncbi:MAG: hypothetical protein FWH57_04220 [Oscillospiraceae bacterium]|nr:hypothetical protein [Oscillospiraceae bacterium]